jgi:hypothetical protein
MTVSIWLAQLLCPRRHALVAVAYERPHTSREQAEAWTRERMAEQHINPWCGLCGSQQVTFEHAQLPYRTMAEARPHLLAEERRNTRTRALFGGHYRDRPRAEDPGRKEDHA